MQKYSVLMSLYIRELPDRLKQSIDSMINQTITPDEIVIVRDGPLTRELDEAIQGYTEEYPGLFKVISSEKNLGLGLALKLGLDYCENDLVARMDTDDIAVPQRCEMQLRAFEETPTLSVVGGNISEFIDHVDNVIGVRTVPQEHDEIGAYLRKRCPFNHMTVMFRKSEVIKAGGYQEWHYNEDYFLWIRMLQKKCVFKNLNESLVYVRVGTEMYERRGGTEYYLSERDLQKYMLDSGIIGFGTYLTNVAIRFCVQIILPNKIRAYLYRIMFRSAA